MASNANGSRLTLDSMQLKRSIAAAGEEDVARANEFIRNSQPGLGWWGNPLLRIKNHEATLLGEQNVLVSFSALRCVPSPAPSCALRCAAPRQRCSVTIPHLPPPLLLRRNARGEQVESMLSGVAITDEAVAREVVRDGIGQCKGLVAACGDNVYVKGLDLSWNNFRVGDVLAMRDAVVLNSGYPHWARRGVVWCAPVTHPRLGWCVVVSRTLWLVAC